MMRQFAWFAVLALFIVTSSSLAAPDEFGHCDLPAGYYRVANTADIGPLHLRISPALESRRIGELQRNDIVFSSGSRVVRDDVTWQSIRVLQTQSWIPARSLWRALPLTLEDTIIPAAGRCGDLLPLWSVSWSGREFRLRTFPGSHDLTAASVEDGATPGTAMVSAAGEGTSVIFVYSDMVCTNANGHAEGWGKAHVILRSETGERLFTGCCQAAREAFTR